MVDYLAIIRDTENFKAIEELFTGQKPEFDMPQSDAISQFKISEHDVFKEDKRPRKQINKDTGRKLTTGEPIMTKALVEVARVAMPWQKIIVNRRVGFMLSDPVTLEVLYRDTGTEEQRLLDTIGHLQDDNKMDYKNKEIARRMMSEMQVAELWYFVENKNPDLPGAYSLKLKILSPDQGDSLFPLFDEQGDMVAFARSYTIKVDSKKSIDHYDVYTSEFEYKYIRTTNGNQWILDPDVVNLVPNIVGKIMVVYYSQKEPEWADVQSMIGRFETLISNHADTNDYFGSPILAVMGKVLGFAQKGETGKILELTSDAKANYLALASEPASIKMELDNLEKMIYAMSQTPNITFEQMTGLGAISGIALKLLFLDAHMAVKNCEEHFGIGLQRRINLFKACIGAVIDVSLKKLSEKVQIKPVITPYLPLNEAEQLTNIIDAVNGGILSTESAVEQNPLVTDSEVELERIKGEGEADMAQQQDMFEKQSMVAANNKPPVKPPAKPPVK